MRAGLHSAHAFVPLQRVSFRNMHSSKHVCLDSQRILGNPGVTHVNVDGAGKLYTERKIHAETLMLYSDTCWAASIHDVSRKISAKERIFYIPHWMRLGVLVMVPLLVYFLEIGPWWGWPAVWLVGFQKPFSELQLADGFGQCGTQLEPTAGRRSRANGGRSMWPLPETRQRPPIC